MPAPSEVEGTGQQLFELNPPEVSVTVIVPFLGQDHTTQHFLRPPRPEDWLEYDKRLKFFTEDFEDGYRRDSTAIEASVFLYDRLALRREGYDRIPFVGEMDKAAAIRGLSLAWPAKLAAEEAAALPFSSEEIPVALAATRSGLHSPRLVHFFRFPSGAQQRSFQRAKSNPYTARDREGKVRIIELSNVAALHQLYRDLAARVEGYAWEGEPYTGGPELAERIDLQHQRAAIEQLFGGKLVHVSRLDAEDKTLQAMLKAQGVGE